MYLYIVFICFKKQLSVVLLKPPSRCDWSTGLFNHSPPLPGPGESLLTIQNPVNQKKQFGKTSHQGETRDAKS